MEVLLMFKKVVALYGVPRSGTSWLGQILDSCPDAVYRYQPLFSYRFKNRITTESSTDEIEQFFQELYCADEDDFLNQKEKRISGIYPVFSSKNTDPAILSYKEARFLYTIPLLIQRYTKIKIVGIIRNPYDVLESWINAPLEFDQEWDILEEWNFAAKKNEFRPENYYGYYKWKEYIKLNVEMQKMYPERFITVRYEDLYQDAINVSKNLFSFLGMPFTDQTEKFIKASQSKTVSDKYGVYRDKNQEYKRRYSLPKKVRDRISKDLTGFQEAKKMGYVPQCSMQSSS